MKLLPAVLSSLASASSCNDKTAADIAANAQSVLASARDCANNLNAAGNVLRKLDTLSNVINKAYGSGPADSGAHACSLPLFNGSDDCSCVSSAAAHLAAVVDYDDAKAALVKQANRAATKLEKRLQKSYCNDSVFQPANVGGSGHIGVPPEPLTDPRPDDHQGPGINGNGVDGMNVGSGTFNKDLLVWHGDDDVGTLSCDNGPCGLMTDNDLGTFWSYGNNVSVDFECINFHELVWWASPNVSNSQDSYRDVCMWVDGVEIHCWSDIRETVDNDRLVGSFKGVMMPNVKKVELRWGADNAEVAEIKVRYEGCAEEPSDNPYAVPESDTFNPANVGGPGPIGPIPDVVEDPRPDDWQGPGINGNGIDGMNVGSGTFNKEVKVWKSNDSVGTLSCTGGSGTCDNAIDGDSDTNFAGGSQLQVDFECINFHEIVFWADNTDYPTQSSYQGLCLWIDDAKVHCWSDRRETVKYDRLVGSNKGQLMKNVSKVELRWADGSESEISKLRVRYEDCDPVDPPTDPYAVQGDQDVWQPANIGAPAPIGPKPDDPQDPRPASHQPGGAVGNGFGTGGTNGNGLDGMNIGSGTFKGMHTWTGPNGSDGFDLSCTGGTGCENVLNGDINSDFTGGTRLTVDVDCINFHEIVFWAKNENPNQASYQGLCLHVDGEKVHCWSDERYTPPYDRLVGSAKGLMVEGASRIELVWAEGAVSELPRLKIRYEDCDY